MSLFKSGLTKSFYHNFLSKFELSNNLKDQTFFVYVEPDDGHVKLITTLMNSKNDEDVIASSVDEWGKLELLSTQET